MLGSTREISGCEVCGNRNLRPALNLGNHPMCDDLVAVGDARICKEYPIDILFCDTCLTAHQHYQIEKHELFPPTYHYRSRQTADVLNGMRQLVSACEQHLGDLAGKKVLDIGCNDGSLLSFFRDNGSSTFGIEPTGAAADAMNQGHTVLNEFFTEASAAKFVAAHGHPDIVTFTNVFAHIEDLQEVIRALKVLAHPRITIVIENHYLGSILGKNQFDTFYHEHPRTYSYTSFSHIADALDMRVAQVEFPERYGGNIRVFLSAAGAGSSGHARWSEVHTRELSFGKELSHLAQQMDHWRAKKRAVIEAEFGRHGRLAAKAFPGRAAILVKLLGLDDSLFSAVYEKPGSGKIGYYVPGTRVPIRSDDEFSASSLNGGPLINLAWHISDEIKTYMRGRGYTGPILDIISAEDFLEVR